MYYPQRLYEICVNKPSKRGKIAGKRNNIYTDNLVEKPGEKWISVSKAGKSPYSLAHFEKKELLVYFSLLERNIL
jgi:hypothetical protein